MTPPQRFPGPDGTALAYRTVGHGPPLLCVPGGPGRASAYLEDLGGLAAERTLVLLDCRGTGASELPADDSTYTVESLAEDVEALRAHLGLPTADVLGHSAGGAVARTWAGAHPDRVGRLVLVATFLAAGEPALAAERERVTARRAGEPWYAEVREVLDALPHAPRSERSRLERELRPLWYAGWSARQQEHAASADHQTAPRAASRFRQDQPVEQRRAALARVRAPVLVVTGELDALTPTLAGRLLADCFPDARLVELAGAGHFPWVDAPAAFRTAVAGFLAGREPE